MRATTAIDGSASVMAGNTRCRQVPVPDTGNQRRLTEKITMNTIPVQKTGMERPASEVTRMRLSIHDPGRDAASSPSGMPTPSTRTIAASASWTV